MKTAVTVLQEIMVKLGMTPEYECISQSGPHHQAMFDYRCIACGVVVTASARSKKEAKQEVARVMLQQLSTRGYAIPPPYGSAAATSRSTVEDEVGVAERPTSDTRSYVALLKELCTEYRLAGVSYELVGDTGPPHLRHFTMKASLGQHERIATATTKKLARQLAAEKLYKYLRENLARVTKDFDEEEALVRAHEKAMERYRELVEEPQRPDLGQKIADYHLGLTRNIDAETLQNAKVALSTQNLAPEDKLLNVASALKLEIEASTLEGEQGDINILSLHSCAPVLTFAGAKPGDTVQEALDYIELALKFAPEQTNAEPMVF